MGIPGLYSFFCNNNNPSFNFSKLDHSKLIIDGTSILHHLWEHAMKDAKINPENEYQIFFDYTVKFFQKFLSHKIHIFVFLSDVWKDQRLDLHVKSISKIIQNPPYKEKPIHYIHYKKLKKDIFVDVLKKLNINFIVCPFRAVDVIATVAKILNYPVLTANADLFLFGVDCIFFRHLLFKNNDRSNTSFMGKIICPRESFTNFPGLDIFCLPLISILLDKDHFPDDELYKIFLPDLSPAKIEEAFMFPPYNLIEKAFQWTSNNTLDSAVKTILDTIKSVPRETAGKYIENIINGYTAITPYMLHHCSDLEFFTINEEKIAKTKGKFLNYKLKNENIPSKHECSEHVDTVAKTLSMMPDWLVLEIVKGRINTSIVDLFQEQAYTVWPHVENLERPSIYEMSLPLIELIYRFLLPYINDEETSPLKLNIRKGNKIESSEILVQKYPLPLEKIRLDMKIKLEVINNILLGNKTTDVLDDVPQDWRLHFATIVFWMNQDLEPKKDEHHLYTLILSMFFTILKDKSENSKDQLFDTMFSKELEKVQQKELPFNTALAEITFHDLKKIGYWLFQMFENNKDITRISADTYHIFLQFQCCLEHSKIVNSLIGFPYDDATIHQVIHVPLIKNLFNDIAFESESIKIYIDNKLKNAPTVYTAFQILENKFNSMLLSS